MLEVTLPASARESETAGDILERSGALAVTLSDAGDEPLLEPAPGQTPLWRELVVNALFGAPPDVEALRRRLASALGREVTLQVREIPPRDWSRAWMDGFEPMRFGQRLWICPSWREPPDPRGVILDLDPGLAFGTGTHPTTALCLEWLDGHPPRGLRLIDYGCGSGVLALAALKLGAAHAHAVDIDPQALQATCDNAARNAIGDRRLSVGAPDNLQTRQADLVLANILMGPLIGLRGRFAELLPQGGTIVLSGLLEEQAAEVNTAYEEDFAMGAPVIRDGWVLLHGRRS